MPACLAQKLGTYDASIRKARRAPSRPDPEALVRIYHGVEDGRPLKLAASLRACQHMR
jgi:hypothetical protein